MKSMGKVKSSVWVPPEAGCPSKEHFTIFPFFIRLRYFKFYFGHLSVDNGNNPNENKCKKVFGGGESGGCGRMVWSGIRNRL